MKLKVFSILFYEKTHKKLKKKKSNSFFFVNKKAILMLQTYTTVNKIMINSQESDPKIKQNLDLVI